MMDMTPLSYIFWDKYVEILSEELGQNYLAASSHASRSLGFEIFCWVSAGVFIFLLYKIYGKKKRYALSYFFLLILINWISVEMGISVFKLNLKQLEDAGLVRNTLAATMIPIQPVVICNIIGFFVGYFLIRRCDKSSDPN